MISFAGLSRIIAKLWRRFRSTGLMRQVQRITNHVHQKISSMSARYENYFAAPPTDIEQAMQLTDLDIALDDEGNITRSNLIFILISVFFTFSVIWMIFADLDEAVRAEGEIVPPSSVQTIQSRMAGAVVEIGVKLGDHVEAGDVLFRLEDEEMQANFDNNEIIRMTSGAAVARLRAEIAGDDRVEFPAELKVSDPTAIEEEQNLFLQRRSALEDRLKVIDRTIAEKEAEMAMSRSKIENLREEIAILTPLVAEGYESRLALLQKRSELAQSEGGFELARIAAERGRDERGSAISEFRARAATELTEFRNEAEKAGARQDALRGKVEEAIIRAPVAGQVSLVHVKTRGAVVQSGSALAEIVPDEKALMVRARVLAKDIAGLYVGQKANISLNAYDVSIYGAMHGQVQKIAANTTQEERMPPYYETMIEIPVPRFSKTDEEIEVVPGMQVVVDILGQKRSVLSYILSPLQKAASVAFREK